MNRSSSSETIASDRLKKAIERNRKKMMKRMAVDKSFSPLPPPTPPIITFSQGRKWGGFFTKLCWGFLFLMILRLIFSDRGIIDYFAMKRLIHQKVQHLDSTQKENRLLTLEIKKLKTDNTYQKKIVREKLGFIDPKEFLIVFSEDSP